ncbi:MAG: glycosyltransferase [Desulfobaccales bacterium]
MNKNILIASLPFPGYLPLMRSLIHKGFNLIMATSHLTREMDAAGLDYYRWEDFLSPEVQALVQREEERIIEGLSNNLGADAVMQVFGSPLGNFIPFTGQQFFQQLAFLLKKEILVMEGLDNLLNMMDLHLILLHCDNDYSERTIVNYARRHGIPSLQLAHGIYNNPPIHVAGEADRLNADHVALFGARARDNFVGSGNPPEKISLTGATLWDPLYQPEALQDIQSARQKMGLDPHRPVVLFCTSYAEGSSPYFRFQAQQLQAVHEAMILTLAQFEPQVQLVVRPHPNELARASLSQADFSWIRQAYSHWLEQHGVSHVHLSLNNKIEAIRAADVVIVASDSSVIPEAMILQKPVLKVILAKDYETTYIEADGIVMVEGKDKLKEALAELISDPSVREAVVQRQNAGLPELNFGNDGRATERVADLVQDMAERRSGVLATASPRAHLTEGHPQSSQQQKAALERISPGAGTQKSLRPEYLLRRATAALERENWPAAEGYLRNLIQCYPDMLETYLTLSDVLTLQGKHREAWDVLRGARHLAPDDLTLLNRLGVNCRQRGDLGGAMAAFTQIWSKNPQNLEILSHLSAVCLDLGLIQEAKGYYLEAIHKNPQNIVLWLELAGVAQQLEDQETFEEACRQAAALNPRHPRLRELTKGKLPGNGGAAPPPPEAVQEDFPSGLERALSSIIIPVFNNLSLTRQCLESIRENTDLPYEIILVDNGSSDGTKDYLKKMETAGWVRVITNRTNLGFARASNQGADAALGEFLVFLNNDTIVQTGWLKELVACARKNDKIAAVGAKLLFPDNTIQHAGVAFSGSKLVYHIYQYYDKDHPAVNKEREFQVVTAACVLIKKDLFFAVGAFDEGYRNGFEDVDLCFKLRDQGYNIVYNPRAVVYHLESKTPGRHDRDTENSRLFKSKWDDKIICDDTKYYEEDGITIEVLDRQGNVVTILAHDHNDNPFWLDAVRYRQEGILDQAEACYLRAMRFNPFDSRRIDIARELADLYETQGKHSQSQKLHQAVSGLTHQGLPGEAGEVRESVSVV